MKYIEFTPAEKAELFDKIAECFYNANFGMLSKAEMELMMFRFYIEKLIENNRNKDGTIDYIKCSDYKISTDLGITQQRVRNLKVKNQLTNPIAYDWKAALANLTKNARFEQSTHKITLNIPDPNLYLDIRNFIEEQGAYVETQLNPKLLQIRAEYYLALVLALEPETSRKNIIRAIKKEFSKTGKENIVFDERNIGKTLFDGAVNLTSLAANIYGLFPAGNMLAKALLELLQQQ